MKRLGQKIDEAVILWVPTQDLQDLQAGCQPLAGLQGLVCNKQGLGVRVIGAGDGCKAGLYNSVVWRLKWLASMVPSGNQLFWTTSKNGSLPWLPAVPLSLEASRQKPP